MFAWTNWCLIVPCGRREIYSDSFQQLRTVIERNPLPFLEELQDLYGSCWQLLDDMRIVPLQVPQDPGAGARDVVPREGAEAEPPPSGGPGPKAEGGEASGGAPRRD